MKHRALQFRSAARTRHFARRGLTFVELLFAVVILGIGMIIIASVFPVAISEQRATVDAVTADALERSAARTLDSNISVTGSATAWLPDTADGVVESLAKTATAATVWDRIKGDLIDKTDPHYAWTGLYQRVPYTVGVTTRHDSITLFIATLASRENAQFDPTNANTFLKLVPQGVTFKYTQASGADPDTIQVTIADSSVAPPCEGAYVIRASNVSAANLPYPQNAIIKLGTERPDLGVNTFEVAPGFQYLGDPTAISTATEPGFLIGRDPTNATGANQVMSCRAVRIDVQDPG